MPYKPRLLSVFGCVLQNSTSDSEILEKRQQSSDVEPLNAVVLIYLDLLKASNNKNSSQNSTVLLIKNANQLHHRFETALCSILGLGLYCN